MGGERYMTFNPAVLYSLTVKPAFFFFFNFNIDLLVFDTNEFIYVDSHPGTNQYSSAGIILGQISLK